MLMAWFKRQWIQYRLYRHRLDYPEPLTDKQYRRAVLSLLSILNEENYKQYRGGALTGEMLMLSRITAGGLISDLKVINSLLFNKQALTPIWNKEEHHCDLDRFLTITEDNKYTSAYSSIKELKTEVALLCKLTPGQDEADYGLDEHNRRLLSRQWKELERLVKALAYAQVGLA